MRLWKQILLSLVLLLAGLALWVAFVPGAASFAARIGVPQMLLAGLAPADAAVSADGKTAGQSGGQSAGKDGGGQKGGCKGGSREPPFVVTEAATEQRTNDQLNAIGTIEARNSVIVTAILPGRLIEVSVKPGDHVTLGQTIAHLDDAEEQITLAQAKVTLADAERRLARLKDAKGTASRADIDTAQSAVDAARLAQQAAELTLQRHLVVAPLTGIAGLVPVSVGDNVTSDTPIVTLDDRSSMKVDFQVPERFATQVSLGQPVELTLIAANSKPMQGTITALDNSLDAASRTLKVEAEVDNPDDVLRAGMSVAIKVAFKGDTFASVNPLAIQWDSKGSFVYRLMDTKVARTAVRIIDRRADLVLVDGDLKPGDPVVTQGIQRIRDGAEVRTADMKKAPQA